VYLIDWRKSIYKIKITKRAETDLEIIGDYIAYELSNPMAAYEVIRGIRKKINELKDFPERNRIEEDTILAKWNVRKAFYQKYRIYYVIDYSAKIVYVIHSLHMLTDSNARLHDLMSRGDDDNV